MKKFIGIIVLILIVSCDIDGYGPHVKTNGVEVFYKPDTMKDQAKAFSEMMSENGYGQDGDVSFQLVKDSIININMVTQEKYFTDESMDYALNAVSVLSSLEIFKDEKVQLHICNEVFEKQRSLKIVD
ncbi:hypothetical protein LX97_00449 [Nonlabens dokdonensis]|jgi:hypothetical protein|uniref:Lipoprotein n=2 Tax=Nonlabens dokdonensis TaxID=328515 RepID=L7W6G3_NONDD|nr:hypothetical protein [Nonlabens dokdonensis]AGC75767.1 hypothetical protein DDD_0639 [Nonlabens dokdonensis DSW-6]PZX43449.1 hypothetical protein LX97_00449 [Nonlabens dokdonensis]